MIKLKQKCTKYFNLYEKHIENVFEELKQEDELRME